ncbi:MAG TPA: hypothetical protein VJ110_03290 [Candidatus Nanoarchaeia archaeon]|nr:hypothetical protein [Candidatus Nanoarchaeia archaeon]
MERLIKNVDEKSWRSLKAEAAKHGKPIGKFLAYLVEEHTKIESKKSNWEEILKVGKILTDEEARKVKGATAVFEKEYGFEG